MTAQEIVARYYDAWQTKHGDLGDVPLADDFQFTGPVASFDNAAGYRAMAREAGQAVTSFKVRRQFVDGNVICSIIDWEMAMPGVGRMTSAELLEVVDGQIVRGELIYDAEDLRRAMAAANSGGRSSVNAAEPEAAAQLRERASRGDEAAFARLVDPYRRELPRALLSDRRLGPGRRRPGPGDTLGSVAWPWSVRGPRHAALLAHTGSQRTAA